MLRLKESKSGLIVASIFVVLAILAFATHLHSVYTNPGDSGESAVVLMPLVSPWVSLIPNNVFYSEVWRRGAYPVFGLFVFFNSFLIYCLFGGLRGDAKS